MIKCLENVSFVTNGIHLQFKRRIICKSYTKYFIYKLNNCLVTLPLITIVELIPSITSRPSMNYPIERFITQSQSDLCLCLFIVTVPILSFLYMCNILLVSIVTTTRWNSTCDILTSAKLSVGYLVVGIYKRT